VRWWQRLVARLGIPRDAEIERGIDALTTEAQRQIVLQYDTGSVQDVKTLGITAAAAAGAALFIPTQHEPSAWVIPLLLLAAAIYCLLKSLLHREFERGPQVPDLYRTFSGSVVEAKESILQELVRAIEHNQPLLRYKSGWFNRGLLFLAFVIYATAWVLIAQTFLRV
jgi:hypothetical protein